MDLNFTILAIIAIIIVIIGMFCYVITTNTIIREQEKEIAELRQKTRPHADHVTVEYINKPVSDVEEVKFGDF